MDVRRDRANKIQSLWELILISLVNRSNLIFLERAKIGEILQCFTLGEKIAGFPYFA